MRDIADVIGIRGASLYHHFPSKEEILFSICSSVAEEACETSYALLDAPGTPTTRLAAMVRAHVQHRHRRRHEYTVWAREYFALSANHRIVMEEHQRYFARRTSDVVTAGAVTGEFTAPSPQVTAAAISDLLHGPSMVQELPVAAASVGALYVELVLRLVGVRPDTAWAL